MNMYRRIPCKVWAEQFTGEIEKLSSMLVNYTGIHPHPTIKEAARMEQDVYLVVFPGDYIVMDGDGKIKIYSESKFRWKFEEVDSDNQE